MNKFLLLWKPYAIFFVDSEIWPNLIRKISEKNIPLSLINARITKKTYIEPKASLAHLTDSNKPKDSIL